MAHRSELAQPNDYITREIIGENILVVRGRDNVLRAFYNVCPHRGHQLLAGDGRAKTSSPALITPGRSLDGELAHARNCENVQNFDKENSHLMPVRVEEYAGFIYVNLDSQAGTVEDQLPGLGAKVREACPQVDDLKLAARFVTRTPANWKNIVDNYLECYHCGPAHPGFADSVQVDRYWHTLHGNWTLQFGYARPSEQSFKFEEGKEASFHGIWLWPCTMFNMPPLEGMMTVIYEFPVDAETTLQHYDIYFTNADLSDEQLKLIDWYRDVFRPEDLRLVESVQKASNRAAIAAGAHHGRRRRQRRQRTRHRPLPQSAGAGLSTLMRRGPRALP